MQEFIRKQYSIFFIVLLSAIIGLSFYLGYQQGSSESQTGKTTGITFSCPDTVLREQKIISSEEEGMGEGATPAVSGQEKQGRYVGSKNGTKYYTPGCSGTNRIKPENYIWFESVEDATLQGYTKGSC